MSLNDPLHFNRSAALKWRWATHVLIQTECLMKVNDVEETVYHITSMRLHGDQNRSTRIGIVERMEDTHCEMVECSPDYHLIEETIYLSFWSTRTSSGSHYSFGKLVKGGQKD